MAKERRCASCKGAMQRFFAEGVELDRCRRCGGVWLDGGELSELLGRTLEPRLATGLSSRACCSCGKGMKSVNLPAGVKAEMCAACKGIYLDDGELQAIAYSKAGDSRASTQGTDQRFLFFYCVECGGRFTSDRGRVTAKGVACEECAGADARVKEYEAQNQSVGLFGGLLRRLF